MKYQSFQRIALNLQIRREKEKETRVSYLPNQGWVLVTAGGVFRLMVSNKLVQVIGLDDIWWGTSQQAWFIFLREIFGDHNQINAKLEFLCKAIKIALPQVSISQWLSSKGLDWKERLCRESSVTWQSDQLGTTDVTAQSILIQGSLKLFLNEKP